MIKKILILALVFATIISCKNKETEATSEVSENNSLSQILYYGGD